MWHDHTICKGQSGFNPMIYHLINLLLCSHHWKTITIYFFLSDQEDIKTMCTKYYTKYACHHKVCTSFEQCSKHLGKTTHCSGNGISEKCSATSVHVCAACLKSVQISFWNADYRPEWSGPEITFQRQYCRGYEKDLSRFWRVLVECYLYLFIQWRCAHTFTAPSAAYYDSTEYHL